MKPWKIVCGVIIINLLILIVSSSVYLYEYTSLKLDVRMISDEYLSVTNKYIAEVNKNKTLHREMDEKNELLQQAWQHLDAAATIIEEDNNGPSRQRNSKKPVPFVRRTRDRPVQMSEGR